MPEYLSPGVYVEEVPAGPRPIQGVGTSTAGFVGRAERGPTRPKFVTNWGDFVRWFGDTIDVTQSYMPFGVRGFFENGGQRAFIARVISGDATTPAIVGFSDLETTAGMGNELRISAIGAGAWGGRVMVWIRDATQADPAAVPPRDWFRITVLYYQDAIPEPFVDPTINTNLSNPQRREPDVLEDFDNLTFESGLSNNVISVLSRSSQLVEAEFVGTPARPVNLGSTSSAASVDLATINADSSPNPNTSLRVQGVGPGIWANSLEVDIEDGTEADTFRIVINNPAGSPVETYDNISEADPTQALSLINAASAFVRLSWVDTDPLNPTPSRPDNRDGAPLIGGVDTNLTSAADGAAITPTDFAGDPAADPNDRTGLAGLALIDEISLLIAPDHVNTQIANSFQITTELINQCESLRDRFAILSSEAGSGDVQTINPPRDTNFGAVYYPWIRVFDARVQDNLLVPPAGHVAGIYARTDVQRGVHKAPANEIVRGMIYRDINGSRRPLEFTLNKGGQDILNPRGVNVIRDFRADRRSIRVWGARTMSSDPLWRYINVRRLFLFVEESIDEGTQWVVFEPNDSSTHARVRQVVGNFLNTVWRSGALQGSTEEQAFFVRCGPDTMTQADIDAGRLICEVGIAPVKPAEFVIFRIQQKTVELAA